MDKKRLHIALEESLTAIPASGASKLSLNMNMWMHDAHSGSPRADTRALNLLSALRSEPELKVFDGMLHVLSISASTVEYWHLAAWLIARAQSVGSMQALEDLSRYLHLGAAHRACSEATLHRF